MAKGLRERSLGVYTCGDPDCTYQAEIVSVSDGFAVSYDGGMFPCGRTKCEHNGTWFCNRRDENGEPVDHYKRHANEHHRNQCKRKTNGTRCPEIEVFGELIGKSGYVAGAIVRTGYCGEHTSKSLYKLVD